MSTGHSCDLENNTYSNIATMMFILAEEASEYDIVRLEIQLIFGEREVDRGYIVSASQNAILSRNFASKAYVFDKLRSQHTAKRHTPHPQGLFDIVAPETNPTIAYIHPPEDTVEILERRPKSNCLSLQWAMYERKYQHETISHSIFTLCGPSGRLRTLMRRHIL